MGFDVLGALGSVAGTLTSKGSGTDGKKTTGDWITIGMNAISAGTQDDGSAQPAPKTKKTVASETPTQDKKAETASPKYGQDGKLISDATENNAGQNTNNQSNTNAASAETKDNNIFRQFFQFLASLFGGGTINFGDNTGVNSPTGTNTNRTLPASGNTPPYVAQNQDKGKGWLGNAVEGVVDFVGGIFTKKTITNDTVHITEAQNDLSAAFTTTKKGVTLDAGQATLRGDLKCEANQALSQAFANGLNASEQKAFKQLKNAIGDSLKKDGQISDEENAKIMGAIQALNKASSQDTGKGR